MDNIFKNILSKIILFAISVLDNILNIFHYFKTKLQEILFFRNWSTG